MIREQKFQEPDISSCGRWPNSSRRDYSVRAAGDNGAVSAILKQLGGLPARIQFLPRGVLASTKTLNARL